MAVRTRTKRKFVSVRNHKKHAKLWAFGYADLARLLRMTEGSLRIAVHEKRLDPADLESICRYWLVRAKPT